MFEELKGENTIMTINEFKQYEQTRPKMRTKGYTWERVEGYYKRKKNWNKL